MAALNSDLPHTRCIVSADIAVPEHERELRFYARILTTGEQPLWRDDLMNNRGTPIIGLGARTAEHADLPLQWMPHIQVEDVAASAHRAVTFGGRELMHGKDEQGNSQWAVLLDPNGAAFGLIPIVPADTSADAQSALRSSAAASEACIAWVDLTVPDAPATRDFYCEVLGWSVQDIPMDDAGETYADFNMLDTDGTPVAGICHARGVNHDLPPVWMIYLPVGDLALSLRHVREEGGRIIKAARNAAGEHTLAAIEDPVGACLMLVNHHDR
jgi:predicted enzyme related to lactoylglutathione lyase